jgi:hypothetical protein
MTYIQTTRASLAGHVRVGVEGSNASISGDDKFHANSGNTLVLPPLDPYGAATRYFDVFSAGTRRCEWTASPWEPWLKLSRYNGMVGPDDEDARVYVSVDWAMAPKEVNSTMVNVNVTTPCRGMEKYAVDEPIIQVPVVTRAVPSNFTRGFVESDGHVAIEGPHYQAIVPSSRPSNATYHTFSNYGRTLGGVGLLPATLDKLDIEAAPALQYDMYLFSNHTNATVTLYISPSHNYMTEYQPLEYAVSLQPVEQDDSSAVKRVRPVGPTVGSGMPAGWGGAVADAVWGVSSNTTATRFAVEQEGAYRLKVWALMPSVIVQKVVVDLGGVRPSYLGPPESFLVGRDERGGYDGTSFVSAPGTLGKRRGVMRQ